MGQQYQTPLHDSIHLWAFKNESRYKICSLVSKHRGFNLDKDTFSANIDVERPISSESTNVRKFIVDGILDLFSQFDCRYIPTISTTTTNGTLRPELLKMKERPMKSFSGKEFQIARNATPYRRIIYEINPRLTYEFHNVSYLQKTYRRRSI